MPRPECPLCRQFHSPTCDEDLPSFADMLAEVYRMNADPFYGKSIVDVFKEASEVSNLERMWTLPAREPGPR